MSLPPDKKNRCCLGKFKINQKLRSWCPRHPGTPPEKVFGPQKTYLEMSNGSFPSYESVFVVIPKWWQRKKNSSALKRRIVPLRSTSLLHLVIMLFLPVKIKNFLQVTNLWSFFCAWNPKSYQTPIGRDCLPFLPIFLRAYVKLLVVYSSEVERLEHEKWWFVSKFGGSSSPGIQGLKVITGGQQTVENFRGG